MKRFILITISGITIFTGAALAGSETPAKKVVDHSGFEILKQKFKSGNEVTKACLSCHTQAEDHFKKTMHWKWQADDPSKGKAGLTVNNFCISTNNMKDKSCLACHSGWNGKEEGVNCLVCHSSKEMNWNETFDDLKHFESDDADESSKEMAEEMRADLTESVTSVGHSSRKSCGSCHFYGGGGDGVKHGDLDTSLTNPDRNLDVHMASDGANFSCTRCHTTTDHEVSGRVYDKPANPHPQTLMENDQASKISCISCHGEKPHDSGSMANEHTDKVACQTCHIPSVARVNPTKTWWDWSKAGKKKDGKPYKEEGALKRHDYMTIKGEMKWAKDLKPEYAWYDGTLKTVTLKDSFDPNKILSVSSSEANADTPEAKIMPFKIHRGKQPFDIKTNTLVAPLLSGDEGYWKTLDWKSSIEKGMAAMDLPFSGEYGFVETEYLIPITHMVAPKEMALDCRECHISEGSRMTGIKGVYVPGRDNFPVVRKIGMTAVLGSLAGVLVHGLTRFVMSRRRRKEDQ